MQHKDRDFHPAGRLTALLHGNTLVGKGTGVLFGRQENATEFIIKQQVSHRPPRRKNGQQAQEKWQTVDQGRNLCVKSLISYWKFKYRLMQADRVSAGLLESLFVLRDVNAEAR